MKSSIIDSISIQDQNKESEVPIYTPEVSAERVMERSSHSTKNKEALLGKLLSKGFNFGIYRLRRSHYVRDEA